VVNSGGPGCRPHEDAVVGKTAICSHIVGQPWPRWAGMASCAGQVLPGEEVWRARTHPTPDDEAADRMENRAVPFDCCAGLG
jgi:hypothetical protein